MHVSLIVLLMLNVFDLINFRYNAFKKHDAYRFGGDAMYLVVLWVLG